jgi:hypothetical protein
LSASERGNSRAARPGFRFRAILKAQSLQVEAIGALDSSMEHDLFGKPASTFPDHAQNVW